MSETQSNRGQLFSRSTAQREAILEAFEAAWSHGERPKIEDFLSASGGDAFLLAELAQTDLEYRFRDGEAAQAVEYLERFPGLASNREGAVDLIVAEFRLAGGTDGGGSADEFLARYPQFTAALSSRLATPSHKDSPAEESTLPPASAHEVALASTLPPPDSTPHGIGPSTIHTSSPQVRYRPTRFHARGGIGEVHLAEDAELGREVALKRIQERHADDAECRRRFLLEAEITARLQHPGIVPIYGLVEGADGQPCYAMRFIEGESVKEAIERFHGTREQGTGDREQASGGREAPVSVRAIDFSSLEFRKLLNRFVDACNAIEYAHSRGVVHRDIKPANIMLGEFGETLVVDWGLAKVMGDRREGTGSWGERDAEKKDAEAGGHGDAEKNAAACHDADGVTRMGTIVGTPQYMSPEQAEGRQDIVGPASDVYSLGATLYTLVTGKLPFTGRNQVEVLEQVRQGEFVVARDANSRVPVALAAVCRKAMSLVPSDRYVSAQALANDIEHWLADEPIVARSDTPAERLARWGRRHRSLVRAGTAALLLVTLVSSVSLLVVDRARRLQAEAHAKAEQALAAEREAEQTAEIERRRAVKNAELATKQRDMAVGAFEELVLGVQQDLLDAPATRELRQKLLRTALAGLERTTLVSGASTRADYDVVAAYHHMGDICLELGDAQAAREHFTHALELSQALLATNPNSEDFQRALWLTEERLGDASQRLGLIAEALDHYQQTFAIREALAAAQPDDAEARRDLSSALSRLGEISHVTGKTREAREYHLRSLRLAESLLADSPKSTRYQRDVALASGRLGLMELELGDVAAAQRCYQRQLELDEVLIAAQPHSAPVLRDLLVAHDKLREVCLSANDTQTAREHSEAALKLAEQAFQADPTSPKAACDLARSRRMLGNVRLAQGDASQARVDLEASLEVLDSLGAAGAADNEVQRELMQIYDNLANVDLHLGDAAGARRWYERSLAAAERRAAIDPANAKARQDLAHTHSTLAQLLLLAGEIAPARRHVEQSLELRTALVESDSDNVAYLRDRFVSCVLLAEVQTAAGETAAAEASFHGALEILDALGARSANPVQFERDREVVYGKLGALADQRGDLTAARDYFEKRLQIAQRRASADPANAETQDDLASAHNGLGIVATHAGDLGRARESLHASIGILEKLAKADGAQLRARASLAGNFCNLGLLEMRALEFTTAAASFERGVALLEELEREGKLQGQAMYQRWLRDHRVSLERCRMASRATGDLSEILALPAADAAQLLAIRVSLLCRERHVDEAVAATEKLRELAPLEAANLYNVACCYALCSAAAVNDQADENDDGREACQGYADLAVEALDASVRAGWSDFEHMRKDPDLNSIHEHPGYQRLVTPAKQSTPRDGTER